MGCHVTDPYPPDQFPPKAPKPGFPFFQPLEWNGRLYDHSINSVPQGWRGPIGWVCRSFGGSRDHWVCRWLTCQYHNLWQEAPSILLIVGSSIGLVRLRQN